MTMRVACLIIAFLGLGLGCTSQPSSPETGDPKAAQGEETLLPQLVIDNPDADVGEVARGKTAQHVFVLKNTGKAPLEIRRAQASCGCTAAVVDNSIIPPGGEGKIDVKLSTQGYSGKITKPVTVETNDPAKSSFQLTITATIRIDLDFERPYLRFHPIKVGETMEDKVPVIVNIPGPVTFGPVSTDMENLKVSLSEQPGLDGKPITTLHATYSPKKAGRFSGLVTLKTSHADHPELLIRAVVTVRGPIEHTPPTVNFTREEKAGIEVTISSATDTFEIKSASEPQGLLTLVLETKTPGKAYTLRATRNEKAAGIGRGFSTWIQVQTNHTSQPLIEIPVVATAQPQAQPNPPAPEGATSP